MNSIDPAAPRSHASADAYDPFDDTRGPVGRALYFDVERIPGGAPGAPARFRKTIKPGVGADLLPMIHRENLLLMDMATRRLRHVAQSLEFTRESSDTPFVVTTLDAGPSLNLWQRHAFLPVDAPAGTAPRALLTPAMFLRLMRQMLLALREFHGAGFVHCDIHAGNVCLPFERRAGDGFDRGAVPAVRPLIEQLRLIDFGHTLSERLNFHEPLQLDPDAPESLRRVSPALRAALRRDAGSQRADAVRRLDFRLDLFALGALATQFLGWIDASGEPRAAALQRPMREAVDALLAQDCDGALAEAGLHDRLLRPFDALLAQLAPADEAWLLPRRRASAALAGSTAANVQDAAAHETPLVAARVTPIAMALGAAGATPSAGLPPDASLQPSAGLQPAASLPPSAGLPPAASMPPSAGLPPAASSARAAPGSSVTTSSGAAATVPTANTAQPAGGRSRRGLTAGLTVGAVVAAAALGGWAWQSGLLSDARSPTPTDGAAPSKRAAPGTPAARSTPSTPSAPAASPTPSAPSAPALSAREIDEQLNTMIEGAATNAWPQVEAAARRIAASGAAAASAAPNSPALATGLTSIERGDYEAAVTTLRAATAKAPADARAWSALGYAALRQGDLDGARRALNRALQLRPHDASAWAHLGELLARQGNRTAAGATLRLAVYFSSQRARTLAHLRSREGTLIAPEFRAVIDSAGSALEQLPPRKP